MDRDAALDRLAGAYATVLRLADAGWSDATIADHLGIEAASVGPMLAIGREKLARLMAEDEVAGTDDPERPGPRPRAAED